MQIEPQVSYRNVEKTGVLEEKILEGIDKLEKVHHRITSVRIAVEDQSGGEETPDRLFRVRINVTIPGGDIVVERKPRGEPHPPLERVLLDAFEAARRQLRKRLEQQRGNVKIHTPKPEGRVARVFPEEGYGFIEDVEGREVYFHENSIMDGKLDDLSEGAQVQFLEEQGDKGPQAVAVYPT